MFSLRNSFTSSNVHLLLRSAKFKVSLYNVCATLPTLGNGYWNAKLIFNLLANSVGLTKKELPQRKRISTPSASLALDYWQEWGSFCWCLPSSPVSTWTCRQAYPGRRLRVGLYDVCRNLPVVGDASFLPDASFPDCRGKKKKRRPHRSEICKYSFVAGNQCQTSCFQALLLAFLQTQVFFKAEHSVLSRKGRASMKNEILPKLFEQVSPPSINKLEGLQLLF